MPPGPYCYVKRLFFILLITGVTLPQMSLSQNLVPNPSFECGAELCGAFQIAPYYPICSWYSPNRSTPDYLSSSILNQFCYAAMPGAGLDVNQEPIQMGSEYPRTGSHAAGIFTFSGRPNNVQLYDYREYLEAQLISPLVPGDYYCAEMFVSLAEGVHYASNHLGMYFHDVPLSIPNLVNLPYPPQVVTEDVIAGTAGWTRIYGSFKATTAALYVTFGNFSDDAHTQFQERMGTRSKSIDYGTSYYFVDDVSVRKLPSGAFTFLGNTRICQGEPVIIKADGDVDNIEWRPAHDSSVVVSRGSSLTDKPMVSTTYIVRGTACRKPVRDTLFVEVLPSPVVDLGADTVLCSGESLLLIAGDTGKEYFWTDGSKGNTLLASTQGTYGVTAKNSNGCSGKDQIKVTIRHPPRVFLGRDTVLCSGKVVLGSNADGDTFLWSSGSAERNLEVDVTGTYWLEVQNRCGVARDSVLVEIMDDLFMPNVITLNQDKVNDQLNFSFSPGMLGIKVINRWGREIFSTEMYQNDWPRPGDNTAPGTYYYELNYPGCRPRRSWLEILK